MVEAQRFMLFVELQIDPLRHLVHDPENSPFLSSWTTVYVVRRERPVYCWPPIHRIIQQRPILPGAFCLFLWARVPGNLRGQCAVAGVADAGARCVRLAVSQSVSPTVNKPL